MLRPFFFGDTRKSFGEITSARCQIFFSRIKFRYRGEGGANYISAQGLGNGPAVTVTGLTGQGIEPQTSRTVHYV